MFLSRVAGYYDLWQITSFNQSREPNDENNQNLNLNNLVSELKFFQHLRHHVPWIISSNFASFKICYIKTEM